MPQIFNVCDRQLLKWLLMIPTSWYSCSGIFPSPECGEDLVTCFLQINVMKVIGCHFWDEVAERLWLLSCLSSPVLSLVHLMKASCHTVNCPVLRCMWQRVEGDLQLIPNSNRADCYPEISLTAKSSQQPHAWAWKHILPLSHLKTTSAPWLQSGPPRCKDNKWLLFKLLNLGVICYAAIDN